MAQRDQIIRIGYLNVVATPHPAGVYERLFRSAASKPVQYWGANTAAITSIRARRGEEDLFTGQILTWIEIDPKSPAVDKAKLEEVRLSSSAQAMTQSLGFNSRVFKFVLNVKTHVVTFEALNEYGQTLSPRRAQSIFERLLLPEVLGPKAEVVDVTVIPDDDALAYVLGIDRLDRVDIMIKRPNADDVTPETHEVLAELQEQNAKRQEIILTRAAQTDGLELSDKNKKYARVASTNGFVSSKGRNADGEQDVRSTKKYPKITEQLVSASGSFISALVAAALSIKPNQT